MKTKFIIFLILIGVAFQSFCSLGGYISDFERTVNGVAHKTIVTLQREIPFLFLIGIGGSVSPEGVIVHESLIFQTHKIINKDKGIEIIARIIDEYIQNFYAEKKLETYAKKHPFTYKNLEITIFVHDDNEDRVYHPGLHMVKLSKGIVAYETVSPSERYYLKEESYIKEPYEEAAKRVGVWSPKIP